MSDDTPDQPPSPIGPQGNEVSTTPPTRGDPLRTLPLDPTAQQGLADELGPGTLLGGRYLLERLLGRGGMGHVYLARDSVLERPVAVKLIRPADPRLRDRSLHESALREAFVAEARIGANLTHPAIATVFDFGFHQDEPFIVFEYVAGETLNELIRRRGRLPLEEVRLILGPLSQALAFAHSRHIVHRDLKPENIRATAQGHFKILDLGLAKEFRQEWNWGFAGTPAYASPEQAAGLPCDGRTDQYALALVAHELLTGRRLFENDDRQELLRLHREQVPPSPQLLGPDLPESVCTALLRALHKDPNQRFAGCEEFAVALGCQLLNVPVPPPRLIRLTAVRRMWGHWRCSRFRPIRKATAVYLALAPDALWVAYRGELRCWPLQAIIDLQRSWWGSDLHLRLRAAGQVLPQSFRFHDRDQCKHWEEDLIRLRASLPGGTPEVKDLSPVEPVVLMRRAPAMRYQVLGVVESEEGKPRRAEVGLQIRAAMMGADAVIDVQEERLPGLGRTLHRRSGLAIRAVDSAGRCELRSRWFATQVSRLTSWMLMLVGLSIIGTILASVLFAPLDLAVGNPLSPGESIWQRIGLVLGVIALIHSWPFLVVLLARWLLWPSLLRPAALAVLALGARPIAGLLGWLAAGLATGRWMGGATFCCTLLDPINLGLLLFAWFLARTAWQAAWQFSRLAPDAGQAIPLTRRVTARLTLATSVLFAGLLGTFLTWGQYTHVSQFGLLAAAAPKERQALADFKNGQSMMTLNPRQAEAAFRRALPLWQDLVDSFPDQPQFRHNLAATYQNLGMLHFFGGKMPETRQAFRQALDHYDRLDSDFPAYQQHKQNREQLRQFQALVPGK
jgi:tRNA A-37 threonylcarbamoyl transferase component Bud32